MNLLTTLTSGIIAALIIFAYVGGSVMPAYSSECKNWGECTKDSAPQGDHASNPDDDSTRGNDNQQDPGPDNNEHRAGLGNVKKLCETTMKDLGNELNNGDCPP